MRCFTHFQDEMKSAPGLFGVTGRQREYNDDVLGSVDKDGIFNYLADLLDAKSPEEFDATLQSLRQRWVERGERWTFLSMFTKTTQNQTTTDCRPRGKGSPPSSLLPLKL